KTYSTIRSILDNARSKVYRTVNFVMVLAYWNIGKIIVEEEQKGKEKAEYGSYLIKELSLKLTKDFGKGFSEQSLRNMRQFYNCFSIRSALQSKLEKTKKQHLTRTELVIALSKINEDILKNIIKVKPLKVITLDKLFEENDQLKTNTSLQMKDAGIEFKVV
ncbi:MAG: DUF1016 domain-containing protein, partial [Mariniphaga sp.]|nr:DUF1016 domain-containing protein [Mariniphaga sp.]